MPEHVQGNVARLQAIGVMSKKDLLSRLEALGIVNPHLEVFRQQVLQTCSIVRLSIRLQAGKILLLLEPR